MKNKKAVKSVSKKSSKSVAHFPKKALQISSLAKKGGVSKTLVNGLLASARKNKAVALPVVTVARFLARGKFCRAYKVADKVKFAGLQSVKSAIVRGLKAVNPRFYSKRIAA